jgi:hypothetical protein
MQRNLKGENGERERDPQMRHSSPVLDAAIFSASKSGNIT